MNDNNSNFLQPIVSAFGLIAAVIGSITPLFVKSRIDTFFINGELHGNIINLSWPSSIISFIIGVLLSWLFISKNGFIDIKIGAMKIRKKSYPEPLLRLDFSGFIITVVLIDLVLFFLFFYMSSISGWLYLVLQALLYVIFFSSLIASFALLVIVTKNSYDYKTQNINENMVISDLLRRHNIIHNDVTIIKNGSFTEEMNNEWKLKEFLPLLRNLEIGIPGGRKVMVITSSDYRRLFGHKYLE